MPGRKISPESVVGGYNNYYEFLTDKRRVAEHAANFRTRPWQIEVKGLVEKPLKFDVDDLLKEFPLEERIYRHRCVEAWSIVVPWSGFPMAKFVAWAKPTAKANYVRMVSFYRPEQCIGQREQAWYKWPYYEALRMDEAMNELAFLVVGSYGHILPNQNGSPLRLATPWKYGYKSIKGITTFEFTEKQPHTFWNDLAPAEYDFLSNVNPAKPHPRWSQASESRSRRASGFRRCRSTDTVALFRGCIADRRGRDQRRYACRSRPGLRISTSCIAQLPHDSDFIDSEAGEVDVAVFAARQEISGFIV